MWVRSAPASLWQIQIANSSAKALLNLDISMTTLLWADDRYDL